MVGWSKVLARRGERGSLIVAALLLFTLLLALGMGLMSSQVGRRKATVAQIDAAQARQLSLAAWQDVRVKLGSDILFPPPETEESFSYSEDVLNDSGELIGTYTVNIDLRFKRQSRDTDVPSIDSERNVNEGIYIITCIGKVGDRGFEPRAERVIVYELDMAQFKVIRVEDRGSL